MLTIKIVNIEFIFAKQQWIIRRKKIIRSQKRCMDEAGVTCKSPRLDGIFVQHLEVGY